MRHVNVKKVSQDEKQSQTTTAKIDYIKEFISVLKNKS